MKLWVIVFCAFSACSAQFSIEGPSDGHRKAQGLKVSRDKGIEYTDDNQSYDNSGFSIQGATDGFSIQGATDGNSNFRIQGATDSNSNFRIQGPTDGNANYHVQGASNGGRNGYSQQNQQVVNQDGQGGRALEYKDPSGLRVNWKSYTHSQLPQYQQQPEAPQYAEQPQPRRQPPPIHRQSRPQPQAHQAPIQRPNYAPANNAPDKIKQLLLFQQQIPYVNSIPEPYRYDGSDVAKAQAQQFQEQYPKYVQQQLSKQAQPQENRYREKQRSRSKRQAEQQYQEPQPHYSSQLPDSIQQLLKFQSQIPYDIIANQIQYRPDKPYVPQPAQAQQNQYQSQSYQQNQGQAYEQNQGQTRPVNEQYQ